MNDFFGEKDDGLIHIKGLAISPELVTEAIRSLPEEKQTAVLMYYFEDMPDLEIAKVLKIPRSTVQYRRTSSFRPLKKYLEDNADEDEWITGRRGNIDGLLSLEIIRAAVKGKDGCDGERR